MKNRKVEQGGPGGPPPPAIPLALNLLSLMIQRDMLAKENEELRAQLAELREACNRGLCQK
jgi:hypothetical protein